MSELVERVRAYGGTADVVALCAAYERLEARLAMHEKRRRNQEEDDAVDGHLALEAGP